MTALPLKARIAILAVLTAVLGYLYRFQQIDDALIYARYVRNALQGIGLVFNAGERVNALTSPLYAYLVLAVGWLTHGHVLVAMAIVSCTFLFLAAVLSEKLAPFSGLLIAATGFFYSQVGMETALFLFMLLLVATLYLDGRIDWLPIAMVLLVLTRAEGAALVATVGIAMIRSKKYPRPIAFVPAVAVIIVYLFLNFHWYGSYLPASAGAKLGQGRSGLWGAWPRAFLSGAYQLKPDFLPILYVVLLVAVFAVIGLLRVWRSEFNRIMLPFLVILFAFYILFNIPGYRWYFAPFIAFAMVYAGFGLQQFRRWDWVALPAIALAAVTAGVRVVRAAPSNDAMGYPGISAWLNQSTPPTARVEAGEIGTLGWDADRYLIDSLGLTTPKNADHIAHRDITSWLAEDHPDYVVVHYAAWTFEDVAKQSQDYERVPVNFGPVVYVLRHKVAR